MSRDQFENHGLQRLSKSSKYEVAPNEADVRGWTVVGRDGEKKVGKVDDLLVSNAGRLIGKPERPTYARIRFACR